MDFCNSTADWDNSKKSLLDTFIGQAIQDLDNSKKFPSNNYTWLVV